MCIIRLKQVSKKFGDHVLFNSIDLDIERGVTVGFIGKNGSGKSVLFKIISGLYKPDCGEVFIRGQRIGDKFDFPPDMGIFIFFPGFIPFLTGYVNLKYLADIRGKINDNDIVNAMHLVGLDPFDKTLVKNYSLGMKQKLGIAQAFMENQDIILLDEPFNALDKISHCNMLNCIKALKQERKTILITSHNSDDINSLCDVIYEILDYELVIRDSA